MDQNGINLLVSGIRYGLLFGVIAFSPLIFARICMKFFKHVAS